MPYVVGKTVSEEATSRSLSKLPAAEHCDKDSASFFHKWSFHTLASLNSMDLKKEGGLHLEVALLSTRNWQFKS